jgi:hypothetical protein
MLGLVTQRRTKLLKKASSESRDFPNRLSKCIQAPN